MGKAENKTAKSAISESNASYSVEIAPRDAKRNTVFYVIPTNFNISSVSQIEWTVNGALISSGMAASFKASEIKRGDVVRASVNRALTLRSFLMRWR